MPIRRGHVRLTLLSKDNSTFYLQIPLATINSLCLRPRKFLVYLGWCILGVEGHLSLENGGNAIETEGHVEAQQMYYYVADIGDLTTAVDLEVLEKRTHAPSEITHTHDDFCNELLKRDNCCVWTSMEPEYGVAMYIIPFKRGSDWLRLIVANRPHNDEDPDDVAGLDDIDDIRNGVVSSPTVRVILDLRDMAILKTPNLILSTDDIPSCHQRILPRDSEYPPGHRYTLQWLKKVDALTRAYVPNNLDAAFRRRTRLAKPSELLLHYNYGAAAVKTWGKRIDVLQKMAKPPRPSPPAIQKLDAAQNPNSSAMAGPEIEGAEGQARWDEDDVILFLWGNSKASEERHRKKSEESARHMERWREGVAQSSV